MDGMSKTSEEISKEADKIYSEVAIICKEIEDEKLSKEGLSKKVAENKEVKL